MECIVVVEVHVSFEERAAARQAEIDALKEAYGVLDQKARRQPIMGAHCDTLHVIIIPGVGQILKLFFTTPRVNQN